MKFVEFLEKPKNMSAADGGSQSESVISEKDDNEKTHAPYPGQSSGRLKNYIKRNYGGKISCRKAGSVLNDPNAGNFYKKRAKWYKSLHCLGRKQVREDDEGAVLTIFDIDDTLMKTTATVLIRRPDGSKQELTSAEFNHYKLKPGEEFDFGRFKDAELFRATSRPIKDLWRTAQQTVNTVGRRPGSRVVIVTARSDLDDKSKFLKTFEDHGLDMSKVHVFRAGNLGSGSSAENKKIIIEKLLRTGRFTETRLFDDHMANLQAFLSLKTQFPHVVFKAYPVVNGKMGRPIIV